MRANRSDRSVDPKLILPQSAIPQEIIRMESPEYIAQRLAMPVASGQLWIAKHGLSAQYVLVAAVEEDSRTITAVPLSNNAADRTSGSLELTDTPMGMTMIAWPELITVIPVRLLSKPLDEFKPAVVKAIVANRANSRIGVKRAKPSNDPPTSRDRRFVAMKRRMEQWHNMCDALPELHAEHQLQYETSTDRMAYADALRDVLHLPPSQRLAVADGRLELTDEQQRRLASAGITKAPEQQAVISDEYLIMAEQPRWRDVADMLARTGEGDPRLRLAHKAQFELAARISGHGDDAVEDAFEQAAAIIRGDERV